MTAEKKSMKNISDSYRSQILVLKAMCSQHGAPQPVVHPKHLSKQMDISAIAQASGLNDEKETQRYLYILEGHKLVSPTPPGDFTSKYWHITEDGVRAVKMISSEMVQ